MGWIDPDYHDDPRFQDDEDWFKSWGFEECLEPALALDHARDQYGQAVKDCESLDEKAESIFRFSTALPAVVVTISGLVDPDRLDNWYMIFPIVVLLLSVCSALIGRRTLWMSRPISVRQFMMLSEPDKAELSLAGSYQGVVTALTVTANWKAKWIDRAMLLSGAGVFLLVAAIVIPDLF